MPDIPNILTVDAQSKPTYAEKLSIPLGRNDARP